ncbi:hypothetical protein GFB49_05910 [Epibacterium sp. SM1979]|uniref:Uncharacterized protein n=2 Tax=Tritonibacter litoralis TaxID=2662264 RepID=A0A843YFC7_9RHOB|nr:hypothetical protein [Tritonibacter litoralis]
MLLAPLLALASAPSPTIGSPALVIVPPWVNATQLAQTAQVAQLLSSSAPMGAFVVPTNAEDVTRLLENGAWFVIDGKRIAEFCAI